MANELIVVEKIHKDVLFTKEGVLDKVLEGIRAELDKFEPDVSTAASRKEIASMSRKVSSSKTFLDQIRKDKIAKAKAEIDSANGLWKPARETLDRWRDETRQPLADFEAAQEAKDQERIARIQKNLAWIKAFDANPYEQTAECIQEIIDAVDGIEITPENFFEFTVEALQLKEEVLRAACSAKEVRLNLDKEADERKAEDERLSIERKKQEEETAKLRAENDRLQEEQAKIQAKQKAEQSKIDEQNREIKVSQDKLEADLKAAKEQREREEFEKRAVERAKTEAVELAKQKEIARVAREKAEAAEIERKKALLPDEEKLAAFSQFLLEGLNWPKVESNEARAILKDAENNMEDIAMDILDKSEGM